MNEVIREKGRIMELEYLPAMHPGSEEKDRKAVFDIFCKNEKGE
ncbi:MAG: Rpn family recombination-promoting nuclease/putative transposase, partial [Dysgonamonadaceae bacterium]|nr:Rpn family recombination-promoting nuclease/putative transposase [Dysgonamonadaceae bacterium]